MHSGSTWVQLLLENWIITVVLIGCGVGLLTAIAEQFRKYACQREELEFKRDLVERGLSVDEIERIVAAKGSGNKKKSV